MLPEKLFNERSRALSWKVSELNSGKLPTNKLSEMFNKRRCEHGKMECEEIEFPRKLTARDRFWRDGMRQKLKGKSP